MKRHCASRYLDKLVPDSIIASADYHGGLAMFEIECPTCEERFSASREPEVGAKLECPKCGELLRVICDDPLEISYWDDEEEEGEEPESYEESLDEVQGLVEKSGRPVFPEDEENETIELLERSILFNDSDEEGEGEEDEDSDELLGNTPA
ncbi:hypothetical protein KAX06_00875 [candidate division WOR-3 bacterium]|nr:hypothetical protein [candidate division WOR-3 bacterium]